MGREKKSSCLGHTGAEMAAGRTATVHERKTQGRVRTRAGMKGEARGSGRIAAP